MLSLSEYTDKDMVKSLARAIELLTEENKELRQEIKNLRELPFSQFNSVSLNLPPVTDGSVSK
jgi:restriction endonuclease S subunit